MTHDHDEIARLHKRLEDGWERINQAEEQGADTGRWTSFWCDLLKQYEALVDEVETHAEAREQARMF